MDEIAPVAFRRIRLCMLALSWHTSASQDRHWVRIATLFLIGGGPAHCVVAANNNGERRTEGMGSMNLAAKLLMDNDVTGVTGLLQICNGLSC
jgi:hypothetical protein